MKNEFVLRKDKMMKQTKMEFLTNKQMNLDTMLLIYPEYVHFDGSKPDLTAVLPVGTLYAGELLEQKGVAVTYQDNQLHPLQERTDIDSFDSYGISVMGSQNIAVAYKNYNLLLNLGVKPEQIVLGGQGLEDLTDSEFQTIFPNSKKIKNSVLMDSNYWNLTIENQLNKLSEEDMQTYFKNELTVLFSQGCKYSCSFCGARSGMKETFFNISNNFEFYLQQAKKLGISELNGYVTSLDFFQQADHPETLKLELNKLINLQNEYGIKMNLRALVRADSYNLASKDVELMSLVKDAGFYQFGFGADGAADPSLLKSMNKKDSNLKHSIVQAFDSCKQSGFTPEILYVFGIEEDTSETLIKTKEFCEELQIMFPESIYRGFPAKDNIVGNRNWKRLSWSSSKEYKQLLSNPELFLNLGYETLANFISHPNESKRKDVNAAAIKMSKIAHDLKRVQSYLTIPLMKRDGHELMDESSFELFKEIIAVYMPNNFLNKLTLKNLPDFRNIINASIPKDK